MATVTSQFSKRANRLVNTAILIVSAFVITVCCFLTSGYSGSMVIAFGLLLLVLAAFALLIHRELYYKMISIQISEREIVIVRYAGHFLKSNFFWKNVDSYEIKTEESESYDLNEVIELKANGKKIAVVSQFYYENYNEIKTAVINMMIEKSKRKC